MKGLKIPEISVIMSVYNGETYLEEAINSVCNQTFTDWELIVINDCSTDKTAEILDKYAKADKRIRVYENEANLKLPSSLNKAAAFAEGKYIARMDADDICLPDRLEKQYRFMEDNPDTALSSCRFMTLKNGVISSGGGGGRCDFEAIKALLLFTNPILHPGVIAKSEVIKRLGYNTALTCTEDLELWTRIAEEDLKMQIQREYLLLYRIHDKQITGTTLERQHKEVMEIERKYYSKLLETMSTEQEKFYIDGIYFKDKADINKFIGFYRWIKAVNKLTQKIDDDALDYAAFEMIAEYKRQGMSKSEIIKGMMCFKMSFLLPELFKRKQRARDDGRRCIKAAEKIGLKHIGNNIEFPSFSK